MLRTTRNMKRKYEKIQEILFDLIPEKWEEIYLYAALIDVRGTNDTGEMYFYYVPKSILKKKPVNVYEVPKRFNINEQEYLKMVDDLYQVVKELKQDFIDTEQKPWTNITISIAHCKFKVEFFYDELNNDQDASYRKHIIWRYRYLHLGGELKKEREILKEYFTENERNLLEEKKEEYFTGIYIKNSNNIVGFDREIEEQRIKEEEQKEKIKEQTEKKLKKSQEMAKKQEEKRRKEEENNKNQILN